MRLRNAVDANDQFMTGHGVVKVRTYKRAVPKWTRNDKAVRALILRSFPKMNTDSAQRNAAARWASVIHLYFRMGYTASQVAEEIGSTTMKIEFVIRSIHRVSKGLRANGTGKLGAKRGRPKKNRAVV